MPQTPVQGFIHLLLMQALLKGQSGSTTHSGLQPIEGFPKKPGLHTQTNVFLSSLQSALAPHTTFSHVFLAGTVI